MLEVIAMIRIDKMNAVKRAFSDAGIPSVTARKVMGRGRGNVDFLISATPADAPESTGGSAGEPRMLPKRMLTVIVPDAAKDKVVKLLMDVNCQGRPGDGKIFVLPILDAIRVRTGEMGETAVNEQLA